MRWASWSVVFMSNFIRVTYLFRVERVPERFDEASFVWWLLVFLGTDLALAGLEHDGEPAQSSSVTFRESCDAFPRRST